MYKNYKAEAISANEMEFNASGIGASWNAEGYGPGVERMADAVSGAAQTMDAPVTQPLIMVIANTTGSNLTSVEIMKPLTRAASYALSGVSFTSPSRFSYQEILWMLLSTSYAIGKTLISADNATESTAISQVRAPFTVSYTSPTGNGQTVNDIRPTLSSLQNVKTQVTLTDRFYLNRTTSFILSTLYANTTYTIEFFPMANTSTFSLGTDPVVTQNRSINAIVG